MMVMWMMFVEIVGKFGFSWFTKHVEVALTDSIL